MLSGRIFSLVSYSPAISADALLAGFRVLGLDPQVLAERAGIAGRNLEEPDAVLPDEAFAAIWSEAMRLMPHEELPTEVGFAIPFGLFGIIDYLAGSAETVEAGLLALRDHFRAVVFGLALESRRRRRRRMATRGDDHGRLCVRRRRVYDCRNDGTLSRARRRALPAQRGRAHASGATITDAPRRAVPGPR